VLRIFLVVVIIILLTACSGGKAYYRSEDFDSDARYQRDFALPASQVCEAARMTLLSQGYMVFPQVKDSNLELVGSKEFKGDENRHTVLLIHTTCMKVGKESRIFATALESLFDVAENKEGTYIGVPFLTPITISSTSTSEAQLKLSGETVTDKNFYTKFFNSVSRALGVGET